MNNITMFITVTITTIIVIRGLLGLIRASWEDLAPLVSALMAYMKV